MKRLYYCLFPKVAEEYLGNLLGLLDKLSTDARLGIHPGRTPLNNLSKKLAPLGLKPPAICGDLEDDRRLGSEIAYLYHLAKKPELLHCFRENVNSPQSELNFVRDQLTLYAKKLKLKP